MTTPAFYTEVGAVTCPDNKTLTIRFHDMPDKFYTKKEDMEYLIKGVTMAEEIKLRRIANKQRVLFGNPPDLPGGTATLTYKKTSVRLNLPNDTRMLLVHIPNLEKLLKRDDPSCPVVSMIKPLEAV